MTSAQRRAVVRTSLSVGVAVGLGVGAIAVWRRLPFMVVVVLAAVTAALLRLSR